MCIDVDPVWTRRAETSMSSPEMTGREKRMFPT